MLFFRKTMPSILRFFFVLSIFILDFSSCKPAPSPQSETRDYSHQAANIDEGKDLKYTLFLDEPMVAIKDIRSLTCWDYQIKSRIPVLKLSEALKSGVFPLIASLHGDLRNAIADIDMLIINVTVAFRDSLMKAVTAINPELPSDENHFIISYLPWRYENAIYPSTTNTISFTGYNVGGDILGRPVDFRERVMDNLYAAIYEKYKDTSLPYYLIGIVADLNLQKNNSSVTVDVMMGLTPGEKPLEPAADNDKVTLSEVVVPEVDDSKYAPTMLVSLSQRLVAESDVPTAKIKFGPFGGWREDGRGFQVLEDGKDTVFRCGNRHKSAIYLKGSLKEGAVSGIAKYFVKGQPVDLRIYDVDLDLQKKSIQSINLFASAGFQFGSTRKTFGCFNNVEIDDQFQAEANKVIVEKFGELQSKLTLDKLFNALLAKSNSEPQ